MVADERCSMTHADAGTPARAQTEAQTEGQAGERAPRTPPLGRSAAISDAISRLYRISARAKHELVQRTPAMKDFAVMVVLANLVERGPQRSATLAGCLHLDPSQVSRHVAAAVRDGLVERRIDPTDGRAIQLVPTPAGVQRHREFTDARARHLDEVVADWDGADIDRFVRYLNRFVSSFEEHTLRMLDEPASGPSTSDAVLEPVS